MRAAARPERVLGALNVYRNGEDVAFTDEEVKLVERFATMAALAVRLRAPARDAARAGSPRRAHRSAQSSRLPRAPAGGARRRRPVAVVLLDLDHFKVINDAHGHAEGDRVLAAAAERLRSVVRASDVVGRLGGEEFVLILPGVDAEAAEDCAERARAALAELTVRGRPVAASAGVAAAPADGVDAAALLENADAALYWAKRTGRGKTVRCARRRSARGRTAPRGGGVARGGHRGDLDRLPAGRRARHRSRRRVRGAGPLRAGAAPRTGRVVRASAPGRARRGARGAGTARGAGGRRPPGGNLPGVERLAARAAVRARPAPHCRPTSPGS